MKTIPDKMDPTDTMYYEGDQALKQVAHELVQSPASETVKSCLDTVLGNWL